MNYLKLHEDILDLLPDGTIQELMELAYQYLRKPILATDVAYSLLGSFPQEDTGDYYWDYLNHYKKYNTEMIMELYEDKIMQSADQHEEPYLVDWGKAARDCPKIVGLIRIGEHTEGFVSLLCGETEEVEDLLKAMKIIQKACSILYASRQSKSNMKTMQQKAFTEELLSGKIRTKGELEQWYTNTGFHPEGDYMVMAVCSVPAGDQTILSCLYHEVQEMFPEQLSFIKGQILYILRYQVDKSSKEEEKRIQKFQDLLKKFHCDCGSSNCYTDLLDTADYINQAKDALYLGQKLYDGKPIFSYQELAVAAIVYSCMENMPEKNYLNPGIPILVHYDQRHHTDFLRTLKSYVTNLGDSGKMVQELHIHRNSLLYRLNKIEELTGCSLKDFETFLHLALNFYIMEMKKKQDKNK